jgi:hypothetical protein
MEYEKNLSRYELRGLLYVQHPHDSAALTGCAIANVPIVAVALSMLRRWEEDIEELDDKDKVVDVSKITSSSSSSVETTRRILINLGCDLATETNNARRCWLAAFDRGINVATMAARKTIVIAASSQYRTNIDRIVSGIASACPFWRLTELRLSTGDEVEEKYKDVWTPGEVNERVPQRGNIFSSFKHKRKTTATW